jgi:hypothetical protein
MQANSPSTLVAIGSKGIIIKFSSDPSPLRQIFKDEQLLYEIFHCYWVLQKTFFSIHLQHIDSI